MKILAFFFNSRHQTTKTTMKPTLTHFKRTIKDWRKIAK